jgi:hypothetical protein
MRTLLIASILTLAITGTASAAEVSLQDTPGGGKTLVYAAAPGEINQAAVNLQGSNYTVQDIGGSPVTPDPPCTAWTDEMMLGSAAMCPAQDVNSVQIFLGDQTDEVSVGGVSYLLIPVMIDAGPGPDRIFSGNGSDTIYVHNGTPDDNVTCNEGDDTVYADPGDTIAADCEHVLYQAPDNKPVPPGGKPAPPANPPFPPAPFQAHVRVGRSTVRYGCSARCTVTGKLLLHGHEVGSAGRVELLSGGAARLRYKLFRAGKRALAARGRLRLRLVATFKTDSGTTKVDSSVLLTR